MMNIQARIGAQAEVSIPLAWNPSISVYMREDALDFLELVQCPVIQNKHVKSPCVVDPDVHISNFRKIKKGPDVMRSIYHLVQFQAAGPKQGDHRVCLGSEGSSIGSAILGTLGGINLLIYQVASKGGLINKK